MLELPSMTLYRCIMRFLRVVNKKTIYSTQLNIKAVNLSLTVCTNFIFELCCYSYSGKYPDIF